MNILHFDMEVITIINKDKIAWNIASLLLEGHKKVLTKRMKGFYVYGSLVWGDFDVDTSDIDTLCLLSSEVTQEEIKQLGRMLEQLIIEYPQWENRIEVHYPYCDGLMHFDEKAFKMGNISPGEPLHIIDAGKDWVDEWYCVQEYAITLFGIDKKEILPHIEKEVFIKTVCDYARSFGNRIHDYKNSCYGQAYAILTICRALYTLKNGEQISKPGAARFVMEYLPEYRALVYEALLWRKERDSTTRNPAETYIFTENFVYDILGRFFKID